MRPLSTSEITGPDSGENPSTAFDALTRREWLHANGIGGFASGTVSGANARRYHGLLVAALNPPTLRTTVLGKLDELVTLNNRQFDLSTNQYPNHVVYPDGWKYVADFTCFPVPTWTYRLGETGATLVKRVYLARNKNTVYVTYTLRAGNTNTADTAASLTLTPLVEWKDYHSEMHSWPGFPARRGQDVGGWYVQQTPASPVLRMQVKSAQWTPAGWWHERITHAREIERGQDSYESLFCPAVAQVALKVEQTVAFVATVEPDAPDDALVVLADWVKHQDALLQTAGVENADEAVRDLVLAADAFVVRGKGRTTLLAGYPWFTDWGRDTMIALPGLCLATKQFDVARDILTSFAPFVKDGLIPNRFPDEGETPDYNTADATLWYVHACNEFFHATHDRAFQTELLPVLDGIIAAHVKGTNFGIGMDASDGLLWCGAPGLQLTWMDAKVDDWVVTPRDGKPVEINALWINALRIVADWKKALNEPSPCEARADRACASFVAAFVRPDGEGLYDVINRDGTPDAAIRPNQIIAAALPTSPLDADQTQAVLDTVDKHLLTPYGLRTLSPLDSRYEGHYAGDRRARDGAYHQGTVWPWLMGAYVDALRRVHGTDYAVDELLAPLFAHLREYGVGGIAEIFDGDAPHTPDGCPWQAWSVGEVLRVISMPFTAY